MQLRSVVALAPGQVRTPHAADEHRIASDESMQFLDALDRGLKTKMGRSSGLGDSSDGRQVDGAAPIRVW